MPLEAHSAIDEAIRNCVEYEADGWNATPQIFESVRWAVVTESGYGYRLARNIAFYHLYKIRKPSGDRLFTLKQIGLIFGKSHPTIHLGIELGREWLCNQIFNLHYDVEISRRRAFGLDQYIDWPIKATQQVPA